MLRSGRYLKTKLKLSNGMLSRPGNSRGMASSSPSSMNPLVAAGTVAFIGGAVTIGAASQFPNFRKSAEQRLPPLKYMFNPVLGPIMEETPQIHAPKPTPKKKKAKDVFESPLREVRKQEEKTVLEDVKQEEEFHEELIKKDEAIVEDGEVKTDVPVSDSKPIEKVEPDDSPVMLQETNVEQTTAEDSMSFLEVINEEKSMEEADNVKEEEKSSLERSPEEVQENLAKLNQDVIADEAAVSVILDDALSSCATQCNEAIESNKEAVKAISLHTSLLKSAMDDSNISAEEKRNQWMDLSRVLEQKSRLQNEAEKSAQEARQDLIKLESVISELKLIDSPAARRKIIETEVLCNDMRKELEQSVKQVNIVLSESHVISQYKDLIDTAKEQFRQELLSVMPDVKPESGWRKLGQKLSTEDLNALIAHAHRRVDQLQRELAEERAISTSRMETAVRAAREKWDEQAMAEMERTVEVLKRESEIEHDKKLEEARQAFENEMRIQLKRQAAAHSEHLTDMLGIQEQQIKNELGVELKEKLDEQEQKFTSEMEDIKSKYEEELHDITDKFQFDLNKALAKVAGIETAVDGRAYVENESRKAQELWLACEALRIAVQYGDKGKPAPLRKEIQAIAQVPGVENHVVQIAGAFPQKASERGVFTEDALRSAYKQVSKMCRRLSLISETRNSFFDYFLSYLKSFLIINRAQTEPPEKLNSAAPLDTFTILSYATYCLEHGDLEQATRFLNQLTGESRRIAEGWLDEARLLLETRQVVEVLSSLASATTIAANLEV